jgi:hypothetical protein
MTARVILVHAGAGAGRAGSGRVDAFDFCEVALSHGSGPVLVARSRFVVVDLLDRVIGDVQVARFRLGHGYLAGFGWWRSLARLAPIRTGE